MQLCPHFRRPADRNAALAINGNNRKAALRHRVGLDDGAPESTIPIEQLVAAGAGVDDARIAELTAQTHVDDAANIQALYTELSRIGVDFVVPAGCTLRPGRQKDLFLRVIRERFPSLPRNSDR